MLTQNCAEGFFIDGPLAARSSYQNKPWVCIPYDRRVRHQNILGILEYS